MMNRKSDLGFGTLVVWAIIIGIGILLLVITLNATNVGHQSLEKLFGFNFFG